MWIRWGRDGQKFVDVPGPRRPDGDRGTRWNGPRELLGRVLLLSVMEPWHRRGRQGFLFRRRWGNI